VREERLDERVVFIFIFVLVTATTVGSMLPSSEFVSAVRRDRGAKASVLIILLVASRRITFFCDGFLESFTDL
jgi:hypothetical protein